MEPRDSAKMGPRVCLCLYRRNEKLWIPSKWTNIEHEQEELLDALAAEMLLGKIQRAFEGDSRSSRLGTA